MINVTKLFLVVYTFTLTLVMLKASGELSWSWWVVFSALIIYEGLGFIFGFIRAVKK